MNADARVNPIELLGKRQCRVEFLRPRTGPNRKECADSRRARAFEHLCAVGIELRKVYVRVRVNQFYGGSSFSEKTISTNNSFS